MLIAGEPKILITSSSYIPNPDRMKEVLLWSRVTRRLNPNIDILLVDSASPFNPQLFARDVTIHLRQPDNIGHPTLGGDGWGRDFCEGISYAIDHDYDWIAFIESDCIFTQPVRPIIDKLCRIGCLAASPFDSRYGWIETNIMFLSVGYLRATNFPARYDWQSHAAPYYAELELEKFFSEELLNLPLAGMRNDDNLLNRNNYKKFFPQRWDYLTHAKDYDLYKLLLEVNGIEIPEGEAYDKPKSSRGSKFVK